MSDGAQDRRRAMHPPRAARWILSRLLAPQRREFLLGDLEEDFQAVADSPAGYRAARRWYWSQTIQTLRRREPPATIEQVVPATSRGTSPVETFLQDVRFATRTLRKSPGFTAAVLLTLALSIGANTAIFSLVEAVVLRPLPVPRPQEIAILGVQFDGGVDNSFNVPLFEDYRRLNQIFSGLCGYSTSAMNLTIDGRAERVRGMQVSGDFFSVLGVVPEIGRWFVEAEDRTGAGAPVVVVSDALWRSRFGGDPGVLGREVLINNHSFTIVGVTPARFTGFVRGLATDLYVPLAMSGIVDPEDHGAERLTMRTMTWLQVFGRMKPGMTLERAQAGMRALAAAVQKTEPVNTDPNIVLSDARRGDTGVIEDLAEPLTLMQMIVGLVLLIACANVANLMLARALARRREMAIRAALGAGAGRLAVQLLTESLVLASLGGLLGLLGAQWIMALLQSYRPTLQVGAALNGRVLAFTFFVSMLTGLLFGLAPVWQATRRNVVGALKDQPGGPGTGRRWSLRHALVVAQIALSLVVLIAAGVCVKSLRGLQNIDIGFDAERVVTLSLDTGRSGYDEARARTFLSSLLEGVGTLPGVEAAGLCLLTPFGGSGMRVTSLPEGQIEDHEKPINLSLNGVTPGYFRAIGVPLLRGRDFDSRDTATSPKIVIVNEALVRRYWPGQEAVGKHIDLPAPPGEPRSRLEVVGVVRDAKFAALTEKPTPRMFLPLEQQFSGSVSLLVRAANPATIVESVRAEVRRRDAMMPVYAVRTLADQRARSITNPRMAATLLSLFGALAMLLGVIGLYGVMAYLVSQRTREIGVRVALGARRSEIFGMVLRQGLVMVAIGLVLGAAGSFATTKLISGLLVDVRPQDPATIAAVAALLALAALAACALPARRATRVDPMVALRYE